MLALSAVLNDKRSSLLPDIPTIAEQGIPEYNYASWFGIVAPGKTPSAIINRMNEGLVKVARMPDIIARFAQDGSMAGNTPRQFRQVIATESERWRKLVQDTGVTVDD